MSRANAMASAILSVPIQADPKERIIEIRNPGGGRQMFGRNRGVERAMGSIMRSAMEHGSVFKATTTYRDPVSRLGGVVGVDPTCIHSAFFKYPDVVMAARIDQVINFGQRGSHIVLTTRDEEYARGINDPANPDGEVDFHLVLSEGPTGLEFADALYWAVVLQSPAFARKRQELKSIAELMARPESEWERCPICNSTFTSRVAGAVACNRCEQVFCGPGLEPEVSSQPTDFGAVVGTRPFLPLSEVMVPMARRCTTWVVRPRNVAAGPMALLDVQSAEMAMRLGY